MLVICCKFVHILVETAEQRTNYVKHVGSYDDERRIFHVGFGWYLLG